MWCIFAFLQIILLSHSYHLPTSFTTSRYFISSSRFTVSRNTVDKVISRTLLHAEGSSDASSSSSNSIANDATTEKNFKGFGAPPKPKEEEPKDIGTITYEKQAKRGVPEYNIFIRPVDGSEEEWVPVGSMTIPRDTPVAKAVYEVEGELLKGTFKLYAKLKAYYEQNKKDSGVFEYGYCLKAFPDEPITIISKADLEEKSGNFISNW